MTFEKKHYICIKVNKGKLESKSKVQVRNAKDLSLPTHLV